MERTPPNASIRVLFVTSEMYPLIKTGGLADVCGALPTVLQDLGVACRVLLPGYPSVLDGLEAGQVVAELPDLFGGSGQLLAGRAGNVHVFVIEAPHLYNRPGNPYLTPERADWPDNHLRFGALGWVAARIGLGQIGRFRPDVVHAHDWQAGLAPAYLHFAGQARPGTMLTIHNLAFQGLFPAEHLSDLRLPPDSFAVEGVEFHGRIGFLKAGIYYADRITTVSPTYAREIQTAACGCGLEGLLRTRRDEVLGILNGIDDVVWNPAADPYIPAPFASDSLDRRSLNKAELQARFALEQDPDRPLLGTVARLTWQKGLDLLPEAGAEWLAEGGQMALILVGDHDQEERFRRLAADHPGRVGVFIGSDEPLAHLVNAGADAIVVPSRYEPCGLTQLYALRYGAVPVVSRVGGLADSVIDANGAALEEEVATGIVFSPVTAPALAEALRRALDLYAKPAAWRSLQRRGMTRRFGWRQSRSISHYLALYRSLRAGQRQAA